MTSISETSNIVRATVRACGAEEAWNSHRAISRDTFMHATHGEPLWQQARERKRKEIDNAIPAAWKVPVELLQDNNATGLPYTSGVMSRRELAITEMRAVDLVSMMKSRTFTAVEVTTAFCKRAAIAHQAVSLHLTSRVSNILIESPRPIVSHTSSSPQLWLELASSTSTSPVLASLSDHFMASRSPSRSISISRAPPVPPASWPGPTTSAPRTL